MLQAIGFQPRVEGYGLEKHRGARSPTVAPSTSTAGCRTNVPHIFAIGDVTAKLMLAHAAEAMGIIAAETIAGAETMELDYVMIPRATYCQPQIASFGWTEAQARERGFDVKVAKFPFTANGKAHGLGDPTGFVKIISDGKHGELLGAHLIGPEVTELLPELTLAQQWDLTVHEVARNVHAHPTPRRGGQGGDPRPRRSHDQHVSRGPPREISDRCGTRADPPHTDERDGADLRQAPTFGMVCAWFVR